MQHETFSVLPSEGQGGISSPRINQGTSMPLGLVNVVGHDFQRHHFAFKFRNLLAYQHFASFLDFAYQALAAVLRTKTKW